MGCELSQERKRGRREELVEGRGDRGREKRRTKRRWNGGNKINIKSTRCSKTKMRKKRRRKETVRRSKRERRTKKKQRWRRRKRNKYNVMVVGCGERKSGGGRRELAREREGGGIREENTKKKDGRRILSLLSLGVCERSCKHKTADTQCYQPRNPH